MVSVLFSVCSTKGCLEFLEIYSFPVDCGIRWLLDIINWFVLSAFDTHSLSNFCSVIGLTEARGNSVVISTFVLMSTMPLTDSWEAASMMLFGSLNKTFE